MNITTKLANRKNYGGKRSISAIKYIVIHYTGNDGDSDSGNANYFQNNITNASAHYFVDDDSITQSVPDNYVAYSVGGKKYADCKKTGGGLLHGIVTNANSISIELCDSIRNGVSDFTENTLKNATELVRELMKKYGIDIYHVCRHFDVTGKKCPLPMIDCLAWNAFKQRLEEKKVEVTRTEFEELKQLVNQLADKQERVYHYWSELPDYARDIIQELYTRGIYQGNSDADLNLPESLMRCLVINYRAGLYK